MDEQGDDGQAVGETERHPSACSSVRGRVTASAELSKTGFVGESPWPKGRAVRAAVTRVAVGTAACGRRDPVTDARRADGQTDVLLY